MDGPAGVVARYVRCVDDGDLEGVIACFAADARAEYDGGRVVLNGDAELRRFFAAAFEDLVGPRHPSSHLLGPIELELDGDAARAETSAVAFLTRSSGLTLRGLRYTDELVDGAGGWRIAHRRHRSLWEWRAPAS